uniref:Nudix hydrolase domain-containing protein n=1 Tax=viral metagenome TaxID=1070528 RepID=A0A6C0AMX9_9ZZZZ
MVFPRAFKSYVPRTHCVNSLVYGVILLNYYNEVALVRGRKSMKWSFPKGHGNSTESPLDASIRELKEETGIDMRGIKPDDEIRFNSGTYFVFIVSERMQLLPEDTEEIIETMWVSLSRIKYLTTNKDLTSFHKTVNIDTLLRKVEVKREPVIQK